MPKLKFRQPTNKRSKLIVLTNRQPPSPLLRFLVGEILFKGGIEFGGQKREKQIEEINPKGVANYSVSFCLVRGRCRYTTPERRECAA
jgi:hypothetical protein